jgi:hypothetical protein
MGQPFMPAQDEWPSDLSTWKMPESPSQRTFVQQNQQWAGGGSMGWYWNCNESIFESGKCYTTFLPRDRWSRRFWDIHYVLEYINNLFIICSRTLWKKLKFYVGFESIYLPISVKMDLLKVSISWLKKCSQKCKAKNILVPKLQIICLNFALYCNTLYTIFYVKDKVEVGAGAGARAAAASTWCDSQHCL